MKTLIALTVICALALSTAAFAQTRTTPVEVENSPTVKVDATANTVKIDSVQNNVKAEQYGPWIVGIGGIPSVEVVNIPTVGINSAANVVSTPTVAKGVKLFTSTGNVVMPGPSQLSSVYFDCAGYREVRVVIKFSTSAPLDQFRIFPEYGSTPAGGTFTPGYVTGETPSDPMIKHATFVQSGGACVFTVPVLSERMFLLLYNTSALNVTVDADRCWVWLVN